MWGLMAPEAGSERQFISYAQNFEDVMLWRALGHVSPGTYIDIGAQDPIIDSVSLAFYERGWRGVHVEPNPAYAERLRVARPDENVIEAAIGATSDTIDFYEIADTGLSTGDASLADEHRQRGFSVNRIKVPCRPLSDILDEMTDQVIHWMKIDVEGMEREVISTWAPSAVRPWIIVIESTKPNTKNPTFSDWEEIISKLGYKFVYFDGLNRFYISIRHLELQSYFCYGPNIFDNFSLSGLASAPFCRQMLAVIQAREQEAERRMEREKALRHDAEQQANQAASRLREAERLIMEIHASRSWRVTSPFRAAMNFIRRMSRQTHEG